MRRLRTALSIAALAALALLFLVACGSEPLTPEDEVRAALAGIEASAEAGDVGAFEGLVSEAYGDPFGHDKQGLMAFATFHVLRNQRGREVILRVRDVQVVQEGRAVAVVHVGLAGSGAAAVRANVYEVAMDFVREDDAWRLSFAEWKPAPPAALL